MSIAKGDRVKIYPIRVKDVYQMRDWGNHENPLFADYNFPKLEDEEIIEWFDIRKNKRRTECFSVVNEEEKSIGFITMKKIKRIRKQATLGIAFDPKYMDKGYGTETIIEFLKYFFYKRDMKIMYLQVARYNERAIKCYEKCGFKKIRQYEDRLGNQKIHIFKEDKFRDIREHFNLRKGIIYNYFYEMKIDKKSFESNLNRVIHRTYVYNSVDNVDNSTKTQMLSTNQQNVFSQNHK